MTKDLTIFVHQVWACPTWQLKQIAMLNLITESYAKKETKQLFKHKVMREHSSKKLDKMASDYMMSGEGMKVK